MKLTPSDICYMNMFIHSLDNFTVCLFQEFFFTGFTFLVGVFMFATVVGNVGDVISNMNAAKVEFQQKLEPRLFMIFLRNE